MENVHVHVFRENDMLKLYIELAVIPSNKY